MLPPFIPGPNLSATAQQALFALLDMPLATASELAGVLGKAPPQVHQDLREIADSGLAGSDLLGSSLDRATPARRWFITDQRTLNMMRKPWHEEGNRSELLSRLPMLQWFYQIAGLVTGLGEMEDFLWLEDTNFNAAALYEHGWIGLVWSSPLETPAELHARMQAWGVYLHTYGIQNAWPARWCFVAADEWQRDLVRQAVRAYDLADDTSVWCITDGRPTGALNLDPARSRGRVLQQPRYRDIGNWPWTTRVESSIWSRPNAPRLHRVFRLIAEYPGITIEMGRTALGEARTGGDFARGCRVLADMGLVERTQFPRQNRPGMAVQAEQKQYFSLTGTGIDVYVRENRGTVSDYRKRVLAQSLIMKPSRRAHEEGVIALMAQFRRAGLAVAAGWRCYVSMGSSGAISPDGLVCLTDGPYGGGWNYLEYERSAEATPRIRHKLRGYLGHHRQDNYPVLVVCRHDKAEIKFQEVAGEGDLRILTTTLDRLAEHGPLGTFGCWSQFGERARIS